jgi:hypothetical protein
MKANEKEFPVLQPELQISLLSRLRSLRGLYLREGLKGTVEAEDFDLKRLDDELAKFVSAAHLKKLAAAGLRGEIVFPVPYLLERNPFLLGYYRLLLGFSQKAFYEQGPFAGLKRIEEKGSIPEILQATLTPLCVSLSKTAALLMDGVDLISVETVNNLQILTLGPQLRGSRNVDVGQTAVALVLDLLKSILLEYHLSVKKRTLEFINDSNLAVTIRFSGDPDISITQRLGSEDRKLAAIEIKGGTDGSNIWNRLGEAEKSHQTAKATGFNELWTLTGIDLNTADRLKTAKQKSPSTTRFFFIPRILDGSTAEGKNFRQLLGSVMGVNLR